jgi:hypothetical protein
MSRDGQPGDSHINHRPDAVGKGEQPDLSLYFRMQGNYQPESARQAQTTKLVEKNILPDCVIAQGTGGQTAAAAQPEQTPRDQTPNTQKSDSKPLQAGVTAQAEEVVWQHWQERLNKAVNEKFLQLNDHKAPIGTHETVTYKISPYGGFEWHSEGCADPNFDKAVRRAVDETLRFHPELIRFPEGVEKKQRTRSADFSADTYSHYSTGVTPSEVIIRY